MIHKSYGKPINTMHASSILTPSLSAIKLTNSQSNSQNHWQPQPYINNATSSYVLKKNNEARSMHAPANRNSLDTPTRKSSAPWHESLHTPAQQTTQVHKQTHVQTQQSADIVQPRIVAGNANKCTTKNNQKSHAPHTMIITQQASIHSPIHKLQSTTHKQVYITETPTQVLINVNPCNDPQQLTSLTKLKRSYHNRFKQYINITQIPNTCIKHSNTPQSQRYNEPAITASQQETNNSSITKITVNQLPPPPMPNNINAEIPRSKYALNYPKQQLANLLIQSPQLYTHQLYVITKHHALIKAITITINVNHVNITSQNYNTSYNIIQHSNLLITRVSCALPTTPSSKANTSTSSKPIKSKYTHSTKAPSKTRLQKQNINTLNPETRVYPNWETLTIIINNYNLKIQPITIRTSYKHEYIFSKTATNYICAKATSAPNPNNQITYSKLTNSKHAAMPHNKPKSFVQQATFVNPIPPIWKLLTTKSYLHTNHFTSKLNLGHKLTMHLSLIRNQLSHEAARRHQTNSILNNNTNHTIPNNIYINAIL
eukprot:gene2797-1782_t